LRKPENSVGPLGGRDSGDIYTTRYQLHGAGDGVLLDPRSRYSLISIAPLPDHDGLSQFQRRLELLAAIEVRAEFAQVFSVGSPKCLRLPLVETHLLAQVRPVARFDEQDGLRFAFPYARGETSAG
jgi:hypothetical protein